MAIDPLRAVLEGGAPAHVIEGDALRELRELPSGIADLILTDPPYSSGGQFRSDRAQTATKKYVGTDVKVERPDFGGDSRDQRGFLAWASLWLAEVYRIAKPGAVCAVFADWRQLPTLTDAFQAGGWIWRGIVVWDKTESCRPTAGRFRNQAEYVVWGSAGRMPVVEGAPVLPGVVRTSRRAVDRQHITGKPVALLRELTRITPAGGLVLDPFSGAGSTGVAAVQLGRRFLGVEMDPHWHDHATRRIARASEQSRPAGRIAPKPAK